MEDNTNINVNESTSTSGEETKTYTQEEVMALLQSEADKRVASALKKQQAKFEKQLSLSKLDGSDREKAEKDSRIAELEEQLAQYQIEKNKSELKSILSSRGLSAEFADIITITDDIEMGQANVELLDRLFKAAVKSEVEKRLAGNPPKGNGSTEIGMTANDIKKMSLAQLQELKATKPELYNKYFG